VPDLDLDPRRRDAVAAKLERVLVSVCPGSHVARRGSLDRGDADEYSDIDLAWLVPGERFERCIESLPQLLARVCPVASVRSDPETRHLRKGRVVFVRFADLPMFWRVDPEISTTSGQRDVASVRNPGAAAGDAWSVPTSALMNAIGAIKAVKRGRMTEAKIEGLLSECAKADASLGPLATEARDVARQLLR